MITNELGESLVVKTEVELSWAVRTDPCFEMKTKDCHSFGMTSHDTYKQIGYLLLYSGRKSRMRFCLLFLVLPISVEVLLTSNWFILFGHFTFVLIMS